MASSSNGDIPAYLLRDASKNVEITPTEAYWLGLPHPRPNSVINIEAHGDIAESNSQPSRAATRSLSPWNGLIHSSNSSNHLMAAYPGIALLRNSTIVHTPSPALHAENSTSSCQWWSSTGYNSRSSLYGPAVFDNADPRYVHGATLTTNFPGNFSGSSHQDQYGLQAANYSVYLDHQHLQASNYFAYLYQQQQFQAANYSAYINQQYLQAAVPTPPIAHDHGTHELGPIIRPATDTPFVYNTQQPNGVRYADPLAELFEQDPRQRTTPLPWNAFEEQPATTTQGTDVPPLQVAATPNQLSDDFVESPISSLGFFEHNGYLLHHNYSESFLHDSVVFQERSPFNLDGNMEMDEYFQSGSYLADEFDELDTTDPGFGF